MPPELENQLDQTARNIGKNKEEWVRNLILEYLREAEDIMRSRDPAKTISLEEMMARYGMED